MFPTFESIAVVFCDYDETMHNSGRRTYLICAIEYWIPVLMYILFCPYMTYMKLQPGKPTPPRRFDETTLLPYNDVHTRCYEFVPLAQLPHPRRPRARTTQRILAAAAPVFRTEERSLRDYLPRGLRPCRRASDTSCAEQPRTATPIRSRSPRLSSAKHDQGRGGGWDMETRRA